MYWVIIIILVLYLIVARIDLGTNITEYENHRVVKGGGFFGGNSLECDEHQRKPMSTDIYYAALWPLRLVRYFICSTLWMACSLFFATDSKFAKWLEKFV